MSETWRRNGIVHLVKVIESSNVEVEVGSIVTHFEHLGSTLDKSSYATLLEAHQERVGKVVQLRVRAAMTYQGKATTIVYEVETVRRKMTAIPVPAEDKFEVTLEHDFDVRHVEKISHDSVWMWVAEKTEHAPTTKKFKVLLSGVEYDESTVRYVGTVTGWRGGDCHIFEVL